MRGYPQAQPDKPARCAALVVSQGSDPLRARRGDRRHQKMHRVRATARLRLRRGVRPRRLDGCLRLGPRHRRCGSSRCDRRRRGRRGRPGVRGRSGSTPRPSVRSRGWSPKRGSRTGTPSAASSCSSHGPRPRPTWGVRWSPGSPRTRRSPSSQSTTSRCSTSSAGSPGPRSRRWRQSEGRRIQGRRPRAAVPARCTAVERGW